MRLLSERGLNIRDVWTLKAYFAKRTAERILNSGRNAYGGPRFRNFFPNLGLVFVHIPKTAGTSVQLYFSQLDAAMGVYTDGSRRFDKSGKCDPLSKHLRAPELRRYLGEEVWNSCYVFSFVRNPWDLMVSTYHWWLQKAPRFVGHRKMAAEIARMRDFAAFIHSPYGSKMIGQYHGNQLDWISDGTRDCVHHVGCTEELEKHLKHIVEQLGLSGDRELPVPRLNQTSRRDYRSYYDPHTAELVGRRFAREIERFEYRF